LGDGTAFVVHNEKGILSVLRLRKFFFRLYEPVKFADVTKAKKWIDSGCFAQIQEDFTELDVDFYKEIIVYREPDAFEKMLFGDEDD
jgi:hypothetical protein